jgi:hypothetical protein
MIKSKVDFPYPVLSSDGNDYEKSCYFRSEIIEIESSEKNKIIFSVKYDLECRFLEELIEQGKAQVIIYIESPNASFRKMLKYSGQDRETFVEVYKSEVSRKITLKPLIVSTIDNTDYVSEQFNRDYFEGVVFEVKKGDILAFEKQYDVIIDDIDDFKNCASIFSIRLDETVPNGIKIDYNSDKINIIMNKTDYDSYARMRENECYRVFLSAMFVLPALVEALEAMKREIKYGEEGIAEKRWYLVLEKQLKQKDIMLTEMISSTYVANLLIGDITARALGELENQFNNRDWG